MRFSRIDAMRRNPPKIEIFIRLDRAGNESQTLIVS